MRDEHMTDAYCFNSKFPENGWTLAKRLMLNLPERQTPTEQSGQGLCSVALILMGCATVYISCSQPFELVTPESKAISSCDPSSQD